MTTELTYIIESRRIIKMNRAPKIAKGLCVLLTSKNIYWQFVKIFLISDF